VSAVQFCPEPPPYYYKAIKRAFFIIDLALFKIKELIKKYIEIKNVIIKNITIINRGEEM
jgi:hypothetical protein